MIMNEVNLKWFGWIWLVIQINWFSINTAYRTKMELNCMCDDDKYDYKPLVVSATICCVL